MVLGRRVVAQDGGVPVLLVDHDVDVAVVVEVAERRAAAHVALVEIGSDVLGGELEPLAVEVAEEQGDLLVVDRLVEQAAVVVDVAVGHEVVGPAVVVEVDEGRSPLHERHRVRGQPEEGRVVVEDPLAEVLVEGVVLVGEVGDVQLGKTVELRMVGAGPSTSSASTPMPDCAVPLMS